MFRLRKLSLIWSIRRYTVVLQTNQSVWGLLTTKSDPNFEDSDLLISFRVYFWLLTWINLKLNTFSHTSSSPSFAQIYTAPRAYIRPVHSIYCQDYHYIRQLVIMCVLKHFVASVEMIFYHARGHPINDRMIQFILKQGFHGTDKLWLFVNFCFNPFLLVFFCWRKHVQVIFLFFMNTIMTTRVIVLPILACTYQKIMYDIFMVVSLSFFLIIASYNVGYFTSNHYLTINDYHLYGKWRLYTLPVFYPSRYFFNTLKPWEFKLIRSYTMMWQ